MKDIVHIDLNAFFAQVERIKDPTLKGKPIAVGYEGKRGVIATSSYEARKKGVFSGMPTSMAKQSCPELILVSSHFDSYREYSRLFFSFLRNRYPVLEQASIDECYIDRTGQIPKENEHDYLFDLQRELFHVTGLKCSIGKGWTKFLAKRGSDYKKPLGLTIFTKENRESILYPISIDKRFGNGKKTAPRLIRLGINTIGDLARTEDSRVKSLLGNRFEYYKGLTKGLGDDFVDNSAFDPKSVSAERTFSDDVGDYEEIQSRIRTCCEDISASLKKHDKLATTVGLKIRNDSFITKSKQRKMSQPSADASDLYSSARKIFDRIYKDELIRLVGVSAEKVIPTKIEKKKAGDDFVDSINRSLKEGGSIQKGRIKK